jgi:beta-fructofuranosidase
VALRFWGVITIDRLEHAWANSGDAVGYVRSMTISRAHDWVWDSWYAQAVDGYHAFHLMAPKSLGDPDLRHVNARVGHSRSSDLVTWEELPDALVPSAVEAFDNLATWTGCVLENKGTWHMFYTGIEKRSGGAIQRIGHAVSSDLVAWERVTTEPILEADARWYSTMATGEPDEPFRDPWVFWHDGQWHMLVTAKHASAAHDGSGHGTMAHAVSDDLYSWRLGQPLIHDSGFRQLEVFQVVEIDGAWNMVFCTGPRDVSRPGVEAKFATYMAPAAGPLGPFDLDKARPLAGGGIYAGRIVTTPAGEPALMGFIDSGEPGGFTGVIGNPVSRRA